MNLVFAAIALAAAHAADPVDLTPTEITEAEAILDANYTPMPEGFAFDTFEVEGVGPLRWGEAGDPQAETTILFIPGFTGAIEYYSDLYVGWLERGYRVMAVDMPGQGGSVRREDHPNKPWAQDFSRYADAMAPFIRAASTTAAGRFFVVGESMGGHVLAKTAALHDGLGVDRFILQVPGLDIHIPDARALTIALSNVQTALGMGDAYVPGQGDWSYELYEKPGDSSCFVDAAKLNVGVALPALRPELRVGGATIGFVVGTLSSGAKLARSEARAISAPVTLITADDDRLVKNDRALTMCAETIADCTHVEIPSGHCIAFETKAAQAAFLEAVDGAIAATPRS